MLSRKTLALLLLTFLFGGVPLAFAQEGVHTSIHRLYESPRAMGMGGTSIAVANDYSAIFQNPAGLARFENWQFNGSLEVGLSAEQLMAFTSELDRASKIENEQDSFNATVEVLQRNYGKQYSLRTGVFQGIYAAPNWSLAIIPAELTLDLRVHNQGTPAINVRAFLDTTIAYGYAKAFAVEALPGRWSWGVTSKFVNRGYANKQVNALDLSVDPEVFRASDLRDGSTVDFDIGFLYSPAAANGWLEATRPTFGFVARNVLDYGFKNSLNLFNKEDTEPPEKLHRTLDFGSKFELPSWSIFNWRLAADFRDVLHPSSSLRKSTHLGAEFDWTMMSRWKGQYRMGVNQGYPTFGASFMMLIFRMDLVTYGEDIGGPNSPRENRMWKVKLNLDI